MAFFNRYFLEAVMMRTISEPNAIIKDNVSYVLIVTTSLLRYCKRKAVPTISHELYHNRYPPAAS